MSSLTSLRSIACPLVLFEALVALRSVPLGSALSSFALVVDSTSPFIMSSSYLLLLSAWSLFLASAVLTPILPTLMLSPAGYPPKLVFVCSLGTSLHAVCTVSQAQTYKLGTNAHLPLPKLSLMACMMCSILRLSPRLVYGTVASLMPTFALFRYGTCWSHHRYAC
jgi:hypothetical protein